MQLLKISAVILILIFSSSSLSMSQSDTLQTSPKILGIFVMTGLASYNISDLSDTRNEGMKSLPFPAEVTDDYPNNPFISTELMLLSDRFDFGIGFTWMSTGTRVHYADYSGEYKFENIVNNFEYTLVVKSKKRTQNPLNIQFALEVGKSLLTIKTRESTRILDQKQEQNDISSYSQWIIKFGGRLSYQLDSWEGFIGALYSIEPKNEISLKFSGIRGIAGIGFRI